MKKLAVFALLLLSGIAAATAAQMLDFPSRQPLIRFGVPDDWKPQMKNGTLFVVSPDGEEVIVEAMLMEAAAADEAAALAEARGTVEGDFRKLKLRSREAASTRGLTVRPLSGSGEDESGPTQLEMAVIRHPAAEHYLLLSVIASRGTVDRHADAIDAIFSSLRAAGGPAPVSSRPQVFACPDPARPDFTVDFPADWILKKTDEGAYVESPDRFVAFNIVMVDRSETAEAEQALRKKIGARYYEVVWNKGGEPEIAQDPELGLTTTFHHAQASDGEGQDRYSVNLATYVRKRGDKTLILICQHPLRALATHGDAIEGIIRSVKVR